MRNKKPAYRFDLVKDALIWIEQHPHKYAQEQWAIQWPKHVAQERADRYDKTVSECETSYCLAGIIVARQYGEEALNIEEAYGPFAGNVGDPALIRRTAEELLDMGDLPVHHLWKPYKSLEDLWETYRRLQRELAQQ